MKKIITIRIIVQFVVISAILIHNSVSSIGYLILCALLALQYILEINILTRDKYSKGAITLIVANLLQANTIPIHLIAICENWAMSPIVFMNIVFVVYILLQILEKRGFTIKRRLIIKRVYDVCSIVFIILLSVTAVATLIVSITLRENTLLCMGLILLVLVAIALSFVVKFSQKKFAQYVYALNDERLWISELISLAYIVINVGMMFVCWLSWFGAIFSLACANGYRG